MYSTKNGVKVSLYVLIPFSTYSFSILVSHHNLKKLSNSWSEHGANNAQVMGSIPVWAMHLGVGLNDPCTSLPTQNILWQTVSAAWSQVQCMNFKIRKKLEI